MQLSNTNLNLNPGLQTLKELEADYRNPATGERKKLKQVAQDFEAVFVQQLLTAMDATVDRDEESPLGGGEAEKTFRGMLNEQMAKNIAHQPSYQGGTQGFGLAQSVYQQAARLLPATEAASSAYSLKANALKPLS